MKEPTVNPNYGGEDEPHPHNDPLVNPNYGGEDEPHPTNDPEVNPNYGGEERNIHVEHRLDKPVDPVQE